MAIISARSNVRLFVSEDSVITGADKLTSVASLGDLGTGTADEIETTDLDAASKTYELGLADVGSFDITLNLNQLEYSRFTNWFNNKTLLYFGRSIFSKTSQIVGDAFSGYISQVNITGQTPSGLLQVAVTVRVTGAVTQDFVDPLGVNIKPVEGITVATLGGVEAEVAVEGTLQLVATVTPTDASDKRVSYSSSDDTVATVVSGSGVVTGVSEGTATITASALDGSGVTGTIVVTVTGE